tara:strand:- start:72 stop:266 length:195 start_codon:yes stop_codon:yes gene_type:complete
MITDGTLLARILKIHPSLSETDFHINTGTIQLQDDSDGKGAYIKSWTHSTITRPTDDAIKEVTL